MTVRGSSQDISMSMCASLFSKLPSFVIFTVRKANKLKRTDKQNKSNNENFPRNPKKEPPYHSTVNTYHKTSTYFHRNVVVKSYHLDQQGYCQEYWQYSISVTVCPRHKRNRNVAESLLGSSPMMSGGNLCKKKKKKKKNLV